VRSTETAVDPETGEVPEEVLVGLEPEHWSGNSAERLGWTFKAE
jgi:hypothetical protein